MVPSFGYVVMASLAWLLVIISSSLNIPHRIAIWIRAFAVIFHTLCAAEIAFPIIFIFAGVAYAHYSAPMYGSAGIHAITSSRRI